LIIISLFVCLMVFNATFNNISVISWRWVLLFEETGCPGENHRPVASHWQTLSHNVVHLALNEIRTHIHVNLPAGAFFSRFWGSLPSTFKIFRPWKKSSTIKSWPTFCDQYFWKFSIWNSRADKKCGEIWMVKVNVIFNDIRLLICLTPL
jgi:hypothetical protein